MREHPRCGKVWDQLTRDGLIAERQRRLPVHEVVLHSCAHDQSGEASRHQQQGMEPVSWPRQPGGIHRYRTVILRCRRKNWRSRIRHAIWSAAYPILLRSEEARLRSTRNIEGAGCCRVRSVQCRAAMSKKTPKSQEAIATGTRREIN